MLSQQPEFLSLIKTVQELSQQILVQVDGLPTPLVILGSALLSFIVISSMLSYFGPAKPLAPSQPYPLGKYDASSAQLYFDERPWLVISRAVQITVISLAFGAGLLKDKLL